MTFEGRRPGRARASTSATAKWLMPFFTTGWSTPAREDFSTGPGRCPDRERATGCSERGRK